MNPILMSILIVVGLGVFAWTSVRRWRLMKVATAPADRSDRSGDRVSSVMTFVFGQKRMFRYSLAGIAHAVIFFGFIVVALRTIILFGRGFKPDFSLWILDESSPLGAAYSLVKDLLGVGVILGTIVFLYYRLVARLKRMTLSGEGVFILILIFALILSDMTYEATGVIRDVRATRAAAQNTAVETPSQAAAPALFHRHIPAASLWGYALSALPDGAVNGLYHVTFWAHSIIVLLFLNYLPYGKHFHVLTVLPNVYYRNLAPPGRLAPIEDIEGRIEREETLGTRRIVDLSWKSVLDLYTCTECGRCTDQCPAANTGKLLSPKHLTINLRDHLYKNEAALVGKSGGGAASDDDSMNLVPDVINPEVLWACTTCAACETECPVFITYIDKIVDMRRHLVMEQGVFPEQLQTAFRGLETNTNPYSFPNEQRADWAKGLDVPLLSDKPDADVLFWTGCSPAFDDRARKIAQATAKLLKMAGVNFAILGPEEQCTGDPARRAGNEYLFQFLATANVETLNGHGVKRIVCVCPHCFNTLKNEYPDFGGNYEVVHHSTFLAGLVRDGKLRPTQPVEQAIAYHDACYLGRHNDVYDDPRDVLSAIPGLRLVEAPESRDRGMCCGAGGAQMWKEEEPGDARVNHTRVGQLLNVLPNGDSQRTIATSCPFCMTMLTDGLRDQGHTSVGQLDISEILLAAVESPADSQPAESAQSLQG
jgi:Fe-S oxidoreductase